MTKPGLEAHVLISRQGLCLHHVVVRCDLFLVRETERKWEAETEGEAGSPWSREPSAGLDPRTLRL